LFELHFKAFKNRKDKPALVLKTSQIGSSYIDRDEILKKIHEYPDVEIPELYGLHANSNLSLEKNESK
jgi:hypothetical protein